MIFRPVFDHDLPVIEGWLNAEHVSPWFENPEEWMRELRERNGEFSFVSHLIAEMDGIPIGFCQYYDCFYAKRYEDWHEVSSPGLKYSLDYMIGDPDYLGRGLGKEMIAKLMVILKDAGAREIIVDPDKENIPSVKAFLANGFERAGEQYIYSFYPE